MDRNINQAIEIRRSHYKINNQIKVSDEKIEEVIAHALKYVPSSFNSQSSRIVLLLGESHLKLWNIVKDTLREMVPEDSFKNTENKINTSFASGYGSILFYEDTSVVEGLQQSFPLYADNFPVWSQQTSAMHQFAIWTQLSDLGLGASLQHYNPVIDSEVAKVWGINAKWKLIAQMPFGNPTDQLQEKEIQPLQERFLIFK